MAASADLRAPTPARPTLRTIARETGVSLAAASMALRGHPQISVPVRKRVQEAARRLGYHPDPKLSSLMQHLRVRSNREYRETLAYVASYASYKEWHWMPHHDAYLGAAECALEMGYRMDVVHLGEPGMTPARMSRQLVSRGIRGIVVGGFPEMAPTLSLDWKQFAAVALDYSLKEPALHRVATNYYLEMGTILDRLSREGCRRIGLNLNGNDDVKVLGLARAAFLRHQETLPSDRRVPLNVSDDGRGNLAAWLEAYRPDAIVSSGVCDFPRNYEEACGRPAPAGIRYVNANVYYADARSRGIDKLHPVIGRMACEHLVAQLQRNHTGLPRHPQIVTAQGEWVDDIARWERARKRWRAAITRKLRSFGVEALNPVRVH